MKRIRILTVLVFLVGIGSFFGYDYYEKETLDTVSPVITADSDSIKISTRDPKEAILKGMTATDDRDGDITDNLVLERLSNFAKDGSREAVIFASDAAGNVTKVTRKVFYKNYRKPKVRLKGPLMVALGHSDDIKDLIHIKDCLDGDLDKNLQLQTRKPITDLNAESYDLTIQAANSAGDVLSMDVTLDCYDPSEYANSPQIELTRYIVYVRKGEEFDPRDYLKRITIYNQEYEWNPVKNIFARDPSASSYQRYSDIRRIRFDDLEIRNRVKWNTPGTYEITYTLEGFTDYRGRVRLVVVVRE